MGSKTGRDASGSGKDVVLLASDTSRMWLEGSWVALDLQLVAVHRLDCCEWSAP